MGVLKTCADVDKLSVWRSEVCQQGTFDLKRSLDRFAKTVTLDPINQLVSTLHFALDFMLQHFDWQSFVEIIFCKKS